MKFLIDLLLLVRFRSLNRILFKKIFHQQKKTYLNEMRQFFISLKFNNILHEKLKELITIHAQLI